jgi:hypothetical protein
MYSSNPCDHVLVKTLHEIGKPVLSHTQAISAGWEVIPKSLAPPCFPDALRAAFWHAGGAGGEGWDAPEADDIDEVGASRVFRDGERERGGEREGEGRRDGGREAERDREEEGEGEAQASRHLAPRGSPPRNENCCRLQAV